MRKPFITLRLASVSSLEAMARAGEDGRFWYADAHRTLAGLALTLGHDVATIAYVMAATSPRVHVSRNLRITFQYLEGDVRPGRADTIPGLLPVARDPLRRLEHARSQAASAALTLGMSPPAVEPPWKYLGPKTGPFALALRDGGGEHIVLDSWMARALVRGHLPRGSQPGVVWPDGPPTTADNDKAYARMRSFGNEAECFRRIRAVARRLHWTPAEVQAAIWTHTLRRYGRMTGIAFPSSADLTDGPDPFDLFDEDPLPAE